MRFEDWPARLHRFFAVHRAEPFAYGERDCCLFACNWILEATGLDLAADFRGQYDSHLSAARVLKAAGGVEAIAERQTTAHGFAEIPVALARRGDVMLTDTQFAGPALGICDGMHGVFPGIDGLSLVPISQCRRAWRIE